MPDVLTARCHEVVRTYRQASSVVEALRGVSASFPASALSAIVGPSGSGKSTLLRILAGIDLADAGEVTVDGERVDRMSASRRRRLRRDRVGYVFQRPSDNLFPHLTIGEHLELSRATSGRRPFDAVEAVGLANRLGHRADQLSGGEQQRAAFALVATTGVRLIVADEPTAQLDDASSSALLEGIAGLVDVGVAVIAATHDPLVRSAADSVVELDHGVLVTGRRSDRPSRARLERSLDLREPAGAAVLSAHGLRKMFHQGGRRIAAVSGASLALHPHELVALTGRSGSGKTTFLNLLSGWEEADGGTIRWADGRTVARRAWRELAVLPQQLGLLDELTVRENVEYPIRLAPDIEVPAEAVVDLLERLGLDLLSHRYPPEVSVGEQQRAALARALVLSPLVVLADEPSGHQDAGWAGAVFDALRRSASDGSACLAATHDALGVGYADRVVHMDDGALA